MACSNNPSSSSLVTLPRRNSYDVFVTFRGKDTRFSFTDHLFAALQRKGIYAFRDDSKLNKGESIAPELLRAIQDSQIFIVVFSKNYASSTWCLRELEYILLHCDQPPEKRVLPVFYDVDPSEVRHQKGTYGEALSKHEQRFQQEDAEIVQRWREALTQVASLSGWDLRDKPQYAEIEKITEEVKSILGHKFLSLPKGLVGIDSPVQELEKLLLLDSVDIVRVVGICGMGGIGKTTLANFLYGKISHLFDACCFIDDISNVFRHDGPIGAQKQILHQALGEEHLQTCNLYDTTNLIQSRLSRIRALLVLDNVDRVDQLEKLALNSECLGAGSRIIITSRDAHILKECGVDEVYKVSLLNKTDSLGLFCRKAFKCDNIISNYEKLTYDILNYANGLPLAIKVLGSFLFDRDISEWRSALARLRETPNKDIMNVLRLSFEGLEESEKEIFLDIACFFREVQVEYVTNVLNCCGFHPDIGLRVLIDKSLISIYEKGGFRMHSLLEELGKKIVQENSTKELRKWSRMWLYKHFDSVMLENKENNVKAIDLKHHYPNEAKTLVAETLANMVNLRLLILRDVHFIGSLSYISNELRYLEWSGYPFMYFPKSFQPNQLVELILTHSSIKQLWEGKTVLKLLHLISHLENIKKIKLFSSTFFEAEFINNSKQCLHFCWSLASQYLPNLRTVNLKHSKNLIKIPDFGEAPNLERLNLKGCVNLVQMDPSIGLLRKLSFLKLKNCINLISIPYSIFDLGSLKYLNLSGCSKVFNNPRHLKILDSRESELHSQLMSSVLKWIMLPFHSLYPKAHKGLASCLLSSLPSFTFLRDLNLSFCGLSQVPDAIGCIRWLERLDLMGNNFVTLPSLGKLSKLVYLNLHHCKQLSFLPELPLPELPSPDTTKKDWNNRRRGGLHIFNTPELGEREHYSSMSFSWMIQFIRANQESYACYPWIDIVIPGSEIPRWFSNQSVGDSLSIDLSRIVHDDNFVGLACCAVFSVTFDDSTTTTTGWKLAITLCLEHSDIRDLLALCPVFFDRDCITAESNHTWLIYAPGESLFDCMSFINTPIRNIIMATPLDEESLNVKVEKCGYRFVFKQDLQQLNLTMMDHKDSLARKRKFVAIDG